jgi:AraC-like DNA-binding protein
MRILTTAETQDALRELALDAPTGTGFAFSNRARNTFYDWHTHDYHQLIYAMTGATQLETHDARFLLPPQRAAWIPAGVRHRTMISDIDGASLYFEPESVSDTSGRVRILAATPLMREMIVYALRWPQGQSQGDPVAQSYFHALALLIGDWLENEISLRLPRSSHPSIARAMDYAAACPGAATQAAALAAAGLSERTFRRLFLSETGLTWQAWLAQLRMMAAMGRLAEGARVTDVANDVGFVSLSAFAKAFTQFTGETPTQYRRRISNK